ncbi:DENN domain-containing protein 2A isoform X1 [Thamnophis elegans]|uniref:DENN domain-containing protein 2A isoform X1 n=1 Tax=Thamnophis elegans TaxID=35005 RepID=UPI0013769A2B|nr:DENN domain-containing protein 2A isoform X1 [Thamnophis elegans]
MPAANTMTGSAVPSVESKPEVIICKNIERIRFASLNNPAAKTTFWGGLSKHNWSKSVAFPAKLLLKAELDSRAESPLKTVEKLMLDPRLDCFQQNMLSPKMIIGDPSVDLNVRESSRILRKQMGGCPNLRSVGKVSMKNKPLSIKDKISEWEGKKEIPAQVSLWKEEDQSVKEEPSPVLGVMEKMARHSVAMRDVDNKRLPSCKGPSKEDDRHVGTFKNAGQHVVRKADVKSREEECHFNVGKCTELKDSKKEVQKENLSVLSQVKKLEQALKCGSSEAQPQLPGTYYSPHCLQEKTGEDQEPPEGQESTNRLEVSKWLLGLDTEAREPIFGTLEEVKASCVKCRSRNEENVYTEPGLPEKKPFINPLPKPRRTFKHEGEEGWILPARNKRLLPPLPSIPPPPLPSSPPPSAISRRLRNGKLKANADHRKSYEFEDLLQSSSENGRVDWYAQSKMALTRTLSEENVYEDILDLPAKENPYEDIETNSHCLGKKCGLNFPASPSSIPGTPTKVPSKPIFFRQNSERRSFKLLDIRKPNRDGTYSPSKISPPSTPSSPDDTFFSLGDSQNGKKRRKISKQLVLKINAIYEARRGKKRVKRLSQSTESSSGRVTDENSESDSDTEEKQRAHSQRLVHVKSRLKQAPKYHTLERDLIEYQERQLFEYFVVVSLHKKQACAPYVPEVTQQFPLKLERSFKFMREAEDQLKAIPQFCFPDAKDWTPVSQFSSETFSFVLTSEDGSRRFGYCRRILPSGKGKRLPEVYCIVSRLGCFNLFSKILDEVEKRRGISPALVQPLMRSVMEAPFPALGRTISIKNFLPGSGTEVIELCRPLDSRLEHVDFESLFSSLSIRHLSRVFASLLLERRVIFIADKLSTLSKCCHATVALLYPFAWQHTYIPVLPPSMIDIVCSPTPFLIGLLSSSLPRLKELPVEEVLVVDLVNNRFLRQMEDEDSILPRKLQGALEHILEQRNELANEKEEVTLNGKQEASPLNEVVSEAFVRFFVEIVGHYSLFMIPAEKEEKALQREAFRKSVSSKSLRRFLEVFMETQMFGGFIQERELRKQGAKGLFEVRAQEYLETLPSEEQSGVNKFLKGLGSRMKFLHKK